MKLIAQCLVLGFLSLILGAFVLTNPTAVFFANTLVTGIVFDDGMSRYKGIGWVLLLFKAVGPIALALQLRTAGSAPPKNLDRPFIA